MPDHREEALRHLRLAFVALWRNECSFASECGEGEARLSPVLMNILEAVRDLGGDAGVSQVLSAAERTPSLPEQEEV